MSDKIANIKNKVAGLKEQQVRRKYDLTMGVDGEAFEMIEPREPNMVLSGRNRGRGVDGRYKFSQEELQKALKASDTENRIGSSIFDFVLQNTGNPRVARQVMNVAGFMPGVGTAMGGEDAYDAARNIPDAYRFNGIPGVLGQLGTVALGAGDAALSLAPFAKPVVKGAAQAARPVFKELEQYFRREGKMQ
jgi:hypothetical protein